VECCDRVNRGHTPLRARQARVRYSTEAAHNPAQPQVTEHHSVRYTSSNSAHVLSLPGESA
jgi:hypothetical protein